jgi:hypothetical protein
MRVLVCLAALAVAHSTASADRAATNKLLKAKVESLNRALIDGDFGKVVDMTHPKIVRLMGGRDKVIALMSTGIKEMTSQGFALDSVAVEDPSEPVSGGGELFAVVPFVLKMKAPGGKLVSRTFVIGVSGDRGRSWLFINGDVGRSMVKQVLPNLPDQLTLPERQKPTLEPN